MKAHIEEVLRRYSYIQTALKEGKTEVNFYVGKRKQKIVIDATLKIIFAIIEDRKRGGLPKRDNRSADEHDGERGAAGRGRIYRQLENGRHIFGKLYRLRNEAG